METTPLTPLSSVDPSAPRKVRHDNTWSTFLLGMVVGAVILGACIAGYLFWVSSRDNKKVQETGSPDDTTVTGGTATQSTDQTQGSGGAVVPAPEAITWKTYANGQYPYLSFKYPDTAAIILTDPDPAVCDSCYSLSLTYLDMKMYVEHLDGIGGMPRAENSAYTIIAGNYADGIGKVSETNLPDGTVRITYFEFNNGGMQFGNFLAQASSFTFTLPKTDLAAYEAIADTMAASVQDQPLLSIPLFSKAWLSSANDRVVNTMGTDNTTQTIVPTDLVPGETIDNISISPSGKYLVIMSSTANGLALNDRFYRFSDQTFLPFTGAAIVTSDDNFPLWVTESDLTILTISGTHYQFNPATVTRTEITQAEYDAVVQQHQNDYR